VSSLLLGFDESAALAARVAERARMEYATIEVHAFPDGESRLRLPERCPADVVVLRSLDQPNAKLVELMIAAETARELGAQRVTLVAPYLGYMRQDVAFHVGEAVSQRIVGALLGRLFDRLVTVDPHLHRTPRLELVVPNTDCRVLSATEPLGAFLAEHAPGALIVGPDAESAQWVRAIAERCGAEHAVATKERHGDSDVEVHLPDLDPIGRTVVLVDDMVSTGRSLIAAAAELRARGATRVAAAVTHGLFAADALEALRAGGVDPVWCTDSVPGPAAVVSLAELLADAIRSQAPAR
jgi:ribose-phosphate pyrophosphokinase